MLLGPVFQTEMVANARRGRYFVLRGLFAAGLLICLWGTYQGVAGWRNDSGQLSIQEAAELASNFFQSFAWLTMITAMVITPAIAAGAISSERERRTIEYLFATDLSNAEIVLSKLFGKLLLVGKLVLVALPVLAIFRLLGGIPGNLLVNYFAGLASTVTLLTVGSMCISVWTPRARDAIIRVYLVEAIVFVAPLILGSWWTMITLGGGTGWLVNRIGDAINFSLAINPLTLLFNQMMVAGGIGVGGSNDAVWKMVALHLGLSVAMAALAVAAVRRVHLRTISKSDSQSRRGLNLRLPQYRPALGSRPMLWKELFARSAATKLGFLGRICVILLLITTLAITFYSYASIIDQSYTGWGSPGEQFVHVTATVSMLLGLGSVILMGLRAAGLITYEKERDCWLSLISTPLTGGDIISAKAAGNLYAFRWMLAPLLLVWLMQLLLSPEYVLAIPLHLIVIAVTGLFATAVGLAYSMRFATSLKSIGATMGTLFFVGGGYLLCCCMPMAIGGGDEEIFKVAMIGCAPFLHYIAGPLIVVEDFGPSDEAWVVVDFILGVCLYGVAAAVILATLVARFEEFVGRVDIDSRGTDYRPKPPTTPSPTASTSQPDLSTV